MIETPIRVKISIAVIIAGAALFLFGLMLVGSSNKSSYFDFKSYNDTAQSADVKSAIINIGYGKVSITTGTSYKMSCTNVADELFEYKISNNVVIINYNADYIERTYLGYGEAAETEFEIVLPNKLLEEVDITIGKGEVYVKGVSCNEFSCTASDGDVTLSGVTVNQNALLDCGRGDYDISGCSLSGAKLSGGTGNMTVIRSRLANLEYRGSFGTLRLAGCALAGDSSLYTGFSDTTILLPGDADDYGFSFDKGRGDITVDGSKYYKEYDDTVSAEDNIYIKNGFGDVSISFGSVM